MLVVTDHDAHACLAPSPILCLQSLFATQQHAEQVARRGLAAK
jgi:hypothetical protein